MAPDIELAVQYELSKTGLPYRAKDPDRWIYEVFDCSSLQIRALRAAGIDVPDYVRNTVGLYNWGKELGALVDVAKAVRTRGAILIKGKWFGFGNNGHTGMSLGKGLEMAAHGVRSGIHPSDVHNGVNYQDGLILPPEMAFYKDLQPPLTADDFKAIAALMAWQRRVEAKPLKQGDSGPDVTTLNKLLIHWGELPANFGYMNTFTKWTRSGLHNFKVHQGLPNTDGTTFGALAAAAILAPR